MADKFGPALPPSLQKPIERDSWMSADPTELFDAHSKSRKERKAEKEPEKPPEYDYSAAGLHIMKQAPMKSNRLFSGNSSNDKAKPDRRKLEDLKAKFKNQRHSNKDSSRHHKPSHFRDPSKRGYSPRRRSKSQSPKRRHRSRSPKRSNSRSPKRRSRSRSPKRRSRSPKDRDNRRREKSRSPPAPRNKSRSVSPPKSEPPQPPVTSDLSSPPITDDDLNKLSAKILKAEISGNNEKLLKLNKKLEELKKLKSHQSSKARIREETIILTTSDGKGNIRPATLNNQSSGSGKRRKRGKMVPTHDAAGERDKYFPDDKNKDLQKLVEEEKSQTQLGSDDLIMKYAGKLSKMSSDRQNWTIDDMFESNISKTKSDNSADKIISQNQKEHKKLESCRLCIDKGVQDSVVFIGKSLYVRVPPYKSLTSYQCQIIPLNHTIATVNADEDFWEEYSSVKSEIVKKFTSKNLDTVFMESAQRLGHRKHIFVDCVPVPMEEGALLPAYYKKAIMDCDVEWAQNKKVVDTKKKGLRKSIPQGLPYFSVEFGTDGGYAHVIEDERLFKKYFGLEIVGGILDCDARLWRNPEKETTEGIKYKKRVFEKLRIDFD